MRLTAKARAAVTALCDLAAYGGEEPVPLGEIARRQVLSLPLLEQVFVKLRRAGLVESTRGAGGGYVLALPPGRVTIAAVVDAMEVKIQSTGCVPGSVKGCRGTAARCLTHGLWSDLDGVIDSYLSGVTLADIAAQADAREEAAHA